MAIGQLLSIHPLVDLCTAVSLAYAIPSAVFDTEQVTGDLPVRHATGTETYATLGGDSETPTRAKGSSLTTRATRMRDAGPTVKARFQLSGHRHARS